MEFFPEEKIFLVWSNLSTKEGGIIERFKDIDLLMFRLEYIKKIKGSIDLLVVGRGFDLNKIEDKEILHRCEFNHERIYFKGQSCPACKLLDGYNDLRVMYFEEYQKNESKGG